MTRPVANPATLPYAPRWPRLARLRRRLARNTSGVAMVEFAFTAPIILSMGLLGAETAFFAVMHLRVSQVAMQVADNASRIGEMDLLATRRVFERDVNEVLVGAERYGANFGLYQNGRVILSSLQRNDSGGQNIRWQRCRGAKVFNSSFGVEGAGATGTSFPGMGPANNRITAAAGTAVMFVEVAYDYQPLTPFSAFGNREIRYTAAFNIRDNRDLSGAGISNTTNPASPVARCNVYSANRPV
ncbi:MAG: pilus assembly protein [Porphyrobacter sp.]|nr:pilus assembly protein [Porphyrobacter sp.]